MTQWNPNPNGTANTNGWYTTSGDASATSDGLKYKSWNNAYYNWLSTAVSVNSGNTYVFGGFRLRNNRATLDSGLSELILSFTDSNKVGREVYIDLDGITFPKGRWIYFPNITMPFKSGAYYTGTNKSDLGIKIICYGDADFNIQGAHVYDVPNERSGYPLESSHASVTPTAHPDNLKVDLDWNYGDRPINAWTIVRKTGDAMTTHRIDVNNPGVVPYPEEITYSAPGTYQIRTGVSFVGYHKKDGDTTQNPMLFDTAASAVNVNVPSVPIVAKFNHDVSYLDINVDAGISEGINRSPSISETYDWNWGDGSPHGKTKVAEHTYAGGGGFPVTLTVSNSLGQTSTVTKTVQVEDIPVPDADFSVDRNFLSVKFIPEVPFTTGTYLWNFGDGTTSTEKSPLHIYETSGSYNVTMTYSGAQAVSVTRTIEVTSTHTPIENITDALRLELSIPAESNGYYNFAENPNGELGGFGYVTPSKVGTLRGTNQTYKSVDGWKIIFEGFDGQTAQSIETEKVRCDPDEFVNWSIQTFGNGFFRALIVFYDTAGQKIAEGVKSPYYAPGGTRRGATPTKAPAGTKYTTMKVEYYGSNVGASPLASNYLIFRRVMLSKSSNSESLKDLVYSDSSKWIDAMGESFEINVNRKELDVGIFTAKIRDSKLDPSRYNSVRPGQRVRLRAATVDDAGLTVWENIYSGKLNNAKVTYDRPEYKFIPGVSGTSEVLVKNYMRNPSAEDSDMSMYKTFQSSNVVERSVQQAYGLNSKYAAKFSRGTGNNQYIGYIDIGSFLPKGTVKTYRISVMVYVPSSITGSAGITVGGSGVPNTILSTDARNAWVKLTTTVEYNGTGNAYIYIRDSNLTPSASIYLDQIFASESTNPDEYFDGDYDNTTDFIYEYVDGVSVKKSANSASSEDMYISDNHPDKTVVSISAYDRISESGGIKEARGVNRVVDLPLILEGKGIPWIVNGFTNQVADEDVQVVSFNENAKLIDQVSITRDTDSGFAFVNRNDALVIYDSTLAPKRVISTFDEADYSDVLVDYDTDACINSVYIKWLRYLPEIVNTEGEVIQEQGTEEVIYGPYENVESIKEWGLHTETFTIHGIVEVEADIERYAQNILDRSSVPRVRVNALELPIYNVQDVSLKKAVLDLYDLVRVKYSHSDINDLMRITSISHSITHSGWLMTIGFKHDGAVASPQEIPQPPQSRPSAIEQTSALPQYLKDYYDSGLISGSNADFSWSFRIIRMDLLVNIIGGISPKTFATGWRVAGAVPSGLFRPAATNADNPDGAWFPASPFNNNAEKYRIRIRRDNLNIEVQMSGSSSEYMRINWSYLYGGL